ncbi:hypothetical protein EH223_01775 [candidate division KSB1 bacterium]|nr:hypothetical protein [candidate division KSB1 bacterium]RQW06771.1 MAG: hypothetical protein EH223_01775 [candidate division KSB1 bacterium]
MKLTKELLWSFTLTSLLLSCGILQWEDDGGYIPPTEYINEVWLFDIASAMDGKIADGFFPRFSGDNQSILYLQRSGESNTVLKKMSVSNQMIETLTPAMLRLNTFDICYESNQLVFNANTFKHRDQDIFVFDLTSNILKNVTQTIDIFESDAHFINHGQYIAYRGYDFIARMGVRGQEIILDHLSSGSFTFVRLSASGTKLVLIQHPGESLRIVDLIDTARDTVIEFSGSSYTLSPMKDELYYRYGGPHLLDLNTFERYELNFEYAYDVTFSPDGRFLVYLDSHYNLCLYDMENRAERILLSREKNADYNIQSMAISPDNKLVAYERYFERLLE